MVGEGTALDTSRAGRRIIERPRLTRLLDEAESRVILLVAPAGYGKTTLARQWLRDRPHAWYQATAASSDVAALALGLAGAVSDLVAGAGAEVRGRLTTLGDAASEAESLADDLARDLEEWPDDAWLVIDDYHGLTESAAAESFVARLVAGRRVPLLIVTRSRPAWVTAKNLLYGEFVEFGRNVLAMTHSEAAEALASSHEEMPGLVALAEGWPAVIGLAALVPYPLPQSASEIPDTLHQYFAEELYDAVSESARWCAVQLSLAPVIDDDVTKALFRAGRSTILDESFRSGFLTQSGGDVEMHPLVRQFLRTKLPDFDPREVNETAEAIGTAYADAQRWDEAVAVASEFQLVDVLLRVLTHALDVVLAEGRLATLRRWLAVTRPLAPTAPIVGLASIEVDFRTGDWNAANAKARQLARGIPPDEPLASRVHLRAGQMAHIDDRQEDALAYFTAAKEKASSPKDLRSALWGRLLTLCDLERQTDARTTLREIENLKAHTSDDLLRTGQGRLHYALRWGGLLEALDAVSGLLDLVDDSNDPLVRTGFLQTYGAALGLVARYDEASPIGERLVNEAQRYHLEWIVPHALQMGAIARMGQRDFDGALRSIDRAVRLAESQGNAHTQVNGAVLKARVYLSCGSPDRAVDLLQARVIGPTSPGMDSEYLAAHAMALACAGRPAEARPLIAASEQVSSQLDPSVARDFARLVISHHDHRLLDRDLLTRTLTTVSTTGIFDSFVCAYRAFPALLQGLMDVRSPDTSAFETLVARLDPGLGERIGLPPEARPPRSEGALTRREREVFELMRQGLSNREIARTLWISESTVKVHVHHVLAKMGARTRTEAIASTLERAKPSLPGEEDARASPRD